MDPQEFIRRLQEEIYGVVNSQSGGSVNVRVSNTAHGKEYVFIVNGQKFKVFEPYSLMDLPIGELSDEEKEIAREQILETIKERQKQNPAHEPEQVEVVIAPEYKAEKAINTLRGTAAIIKLTKAEQKAVDSIITKLEKKYGEIS